ncbi:hypothetical protein ACFL35_21385 [Candidatus Riflebacteria bacterium]
MSKKKNEDFNVTQLGVPEFRNPRDANKSLSTFTSDEDRIPFGIRSSDSQEDKNKYLELAGPRKRIFFQPEKCSAAIVTCGGLCPGLNDVHGAFLRLRRKENPGGQIWLSGIKPECGETHDPADSRFSQGDSVSRGDDSGFFERKP